MARDELLEMEGGGEEVLPTMPFRVALSDGASVLAHVSGKARP